jgi:hypothetical protein
MHYTKITTNYCFTFEKLSNLIRLAHHNDVVVYYVVRSVLDIDAKQNKAEQYRNKNLKKLCHCEARSNRELCRLPVYLRLPRYRSQ